MRITTPLLVSLALAFCTLELSAQTFTEISADLGMIYSYDDWNYIGGGVAFFDYDNDGDEDCYFTGGKNPDQLYRNNGDGSFTNVSEGIGLEITGTYYTAGVTTGDIDNDGYREIYVTTYGFNNDFGSIRRDLLFRNNGDGTFTEIGALANISSAARSVSATFLDHDQDGFLDIYVVNYVEETRVTTDEDGEVNGFDHDCYENFFYHNNGNLTFTPAAVELNVAGTGCGLAVTNLDFEGDGDTDLYAINDFGQFIVPNQMLLNNSGTGTFDRPETDTINDIHIGLYGMGIAWGDYDLDLDYDYYVSNIDDNALLNNDGNLFFTDVATAAGVQNDRTINDLRVTSWGNAFADVNNDLYEDLLVSNGYIPAAEFILTDRIDPDKLYLNNGDGTFSDISDTAGFNSTERGRGLAYADYDQDGDLDIFVNILEEPTIGANVRFYRNDLANEHNWVQLKLEGTVSNRDAIGSSIALHITNGPTLLRQITGGGSHASQHSSVAHFGLADHSSIDSIVVRWPDGQEETFPGLAVNQRHILTEASAPLLRIEFRLDMSFQESSNEGVFVEINDENGSTTRHLMYSPFQDDQYSVFVNRPPGFSGHFRFLNGPCIAYECAEDLSNEGCGDPTMDYARILNPITNDTIINACFGICPGVPCQTTVDTFQVDFSVNAVTLDEDLSTIYLVGSSLDGSPLEMQDPDGDGRFDLSLTLAEDRLPLYYTYTNGPCPDLTCAEDLSGQGCTDEANDYFRFLPLLSQDTSLNDCFGVCNSDSCFAPIDTFRVVINVNLSNEEFNPTGVYIVGDFFGPPGATPMFDGDGDLIYTNILQIPENAVNNFIFSNGLSNCPGGDCTEDLSGQDCADPAQNNYRTFPTLTADTTLNFCFGSCNPADCLPAPDSIDITFNVNMDPVGEVSADGVYWLFNDFAPPGTYPMTDPDGDNTYSITIRQPAGYTTYFSVANGLCPDLSCREDISGQDCAEPFELNYRLLEPIFSDSTVNLCFGSCDTENCVAPVDSFNIEINVNMVAVETAVDGVFLVDGIFGSPDTYELTDPDGDDIYTITTRQPEGFSSYYSFANGNCPDLNCDEDLSGQMCGPSNPGNNRWIPPLSQDTVINTCFAECIPDLNCTIPPQPVAVTFAFFDPAAEAQAVFLNGAFNLPETDFPLTESTMGTGEWSVTVDLLPGTYSYRFGLGAPMDGVLETFADGVADTCTVVIMEERFREVTVAEEPIALEAVCFDLCATCEIIDNTLEAPVDELSFSLQPNPASEQALISWPEIPGASTLQIRVFNATGQVIEQYNIASIERQLLLDTKNLAGGLYLIQVSNSERQVTKKLIVRQ
ncbi:MAG: FG-GAP-like repeat-containing protein [Bacteroidota bacterium]